MAAQERIIGGGFLFIGVAIVLVLLYFFAWGGGSPKEAYDEILDEIFPAWEKAAKANDYTAMEEQAQKLLDAMEGGGKATVEQYITAEASSGRGAGSRLHKLVGAGTFEKNADGKFGFDRDWFERRAHRALSELADAVNNRLKVLRNIRRTARDTRAAIDEARTGSGLPLAVPAPKATARDDSPIVRPNPIYEHDAALYAVFGVVAKDVEAALQSKDPGGRSTSARLRWNQKIATSSLGTDVSDIPERADELDHIATQIEESAKILETLPEAAKALEKLLLRGATKVGSDLGEPHRAAFKENAAAFAKGTALVKVLRNERKLLASYLATVRSLGVVLAKKFQ